MTTSDSDNDTPAAEPEKSPADGAPTSEGLFREMAVIYVAAVALIYVCVLVGEAVPFVAQNLYALVGAVFVGLPYLWLSRKGLDFERFGLTWERAGRGVIWGLAFAVLTVGPFAVGYWWWQTEVQQRSYEFSVDNLYQWPVELSGRPSEWGDTPGVWVWADGPRLHVGMRASDEPVEVELRAEESFEPQVFGPATVESDTGGARPAKSHRVRLQPTDHRAEIVLGGAAMRGPPRSIKIEARRPATGEPVALRQGASAAPGDASLELGRGLGWLLLWTLTQLVFIALPEEFFYRGYLQTRLGQALAAWRSRRGRSPQGRRPLGLSAENFWTSALFAVGHVVIPIGGVFVVSRLAVFFPSLVFGWLRERTGTIAAPVVYHAAANLMVLVAAPHFF